MISAEDRNAWATYYANQGTKVVFANGKLGMVCRDTSFCFFFVGISFKISHVMLKVQGALKMGRLAKTLAAGVNIKRKAKGLLPRPVCYFRLQTCHHASLTY